MQTFGNCHVSYEKTVVLAIKFDPQPFHRDEEAAAKK